MPKRQLRRYQLVPFSNGGTELPTVFIDVGSDSAAVGRAGTLCKKNNGPVDIATTEDADWDQRYLTTVSPSEFHQKGYRCERLS